MDLTADAIAALQKSGETVLFPDINGVTYSNKPLHVLSPFLPDPLKVITLNALVDLFIANFEGISFLSTAPILHVTSFDAVELLCPVSDKSGRRTLFAKAKLSFVEKFKFGEWHSQEQFIIALQSQFAPTEQRDKVLKVASKIASEDRLTVEDSGIHQTATAKSGVALVEQIDISPRISLTPWRTFREVTQPESEFIFRIKKSGDGRPVLALFEADGGQWQLTAMNSIANYLTGLLPTVSVIQ